MLDARPDSTDGVSARGPSTALRTGLPFPIDQPITPADDAEPIATFERELAAFLGDAPRVIACAGHERALELAFTVALEGHDATESEVVLPALGADRAARVALRLGAAVVPVDVEQDTGNLAPRALMAAIGPRTRAVFVTHLFGHPATMPELLRLAEHHGLAVIEDISEALGAAHSSVPVGALGAIAVLGGGAGHILSAEGVGAVLAPDDESALRVRALRDASPDALDEAAFRIALAELRGAPDALHARRQAAWHLTYELRSTRGVSPMFHGRRVRHAYDRYVVRLRSVLWHRSVEETAAALTAAGIPAAVAAGPLLHEDVDVRARLEDDPRIEDGRFAVARQLASEFVAIPLPAAITSSDMDRVATAILELASMSEREAPELIQ